jgi:AcrR family transcriptional regulator
MIKKTFKNLNLEKQEYIVNKIIEQVKLDSVKKFNITNFTKNAKIAKGSFYQYFESKEDAIATAFQFYIEQKDDLYILNEVDDFMDDLIEILYIYGQLKTNSDIKIYQLAADKLFETQLNKRVEQLTSELNFKNPERIKLIMQIVLDSFSYNVLIDYQAHRDGSSLLKDNLMVKIEFIKSLLKRLEKNDYT